MDKWINGWTDTGWKNNIALVYPYHGGQSSSKFGLILPSGLGEDSMPDRQMDGGIHNIPITY